MTRTRPTKGKKRPGPKSIYHYGFAERAYRLALLGLKDDEIGMALGIAVQTVAKFKLEYPEFNNAIQQGRKEADSKVAQSIYRRAIGYTCEDSHITVHKPKPTKRDPDPRPVVITTPITKHYPPDTSAAIFWLTNRQREHWTNTQKLELSGNIEYRYSDPALLNDLSDTELQALNKIGIHKLLPELRDN